MSNLSLVSDAHDTWIGNDLKSVSSCHWLHGVSAWASKKNTRWTQSLTCNVDVLNIWKHGEF